MMRLKINYFLTFIVLLTLGSCDEGDEPGEQLLPVIELSAESIGPGGETLTIDASASTGTSADTRYVWTISGPSGVISDGGNHQAILYSGNNNVEINTSESVLQFTSEGSGQFTVNLRLEDNGTFAEGNSASFTVAGSIHLSEVPDGYEFIDVNIDESIPDYIFDGDVEIGNASLDLEGGYSLVFQVPEGGQVSMNGTLDFAGNQRLTITSPSETTWKGMTMGGEFSSTGALHLKLINAGGSAIDDYEPSAIVVEAGSPSPNISLETENCQGYDVSFGPSVTSISTSNNPLLHFTGDGDGIYASIHLWGYLGVSQNTLSLEADIDVQQELSIGYGGSSIPVRGDVYIKGNGATISNNITIGSSSSKGTIYMEEDAALIFGSGVTLSGADIRAVGDAPWRGIYIGGINNNSAIYGITITNAGSDVITSGAITATEKAAVYMQGKGFTNFEFSTITGSGGYGVFMNANMTPGASNKSAYEQNTFESTANAAVRIPQEYGAMFSGNDNTFTMDEGVAAVEVFQTAGGTVYNNWTWESLGGSNFYHFTGNLNVNAGSVNMSIGEGAIFRFNAGKGFLFSSNGTLEITGTSENPVVLEAANDSWGGLFVGGSGTTPPSSRFIADYLTIDGGGDVTYLGATEKANLIVNTSLGDPPSEANFSVTNCTFRNSSAGWGAVLDNGNSFSMDLEDVSLSNTFEGNELGAFEDKTL